MTLTEFLKDRVADRERALDDAMYYTLPDGTRIRPNVEPGEDVEAVKAKIFRHELAECEAKRRIVQMLVDVDASSEFDGPAEPDWVSASEPDGWNATTNTLVHVLCIMAAPYADHPDYDEAWRP